MLTSWPPLQVLQVWKDFPPPLVCKKMQIQMQESSLCLYTPLGPLRVLDVPTPDPSKCTSFQGQSASSGFFLFFFFSHRCLGEGVGGKGNFLWSVMGQEAKKPGLFGGRAETICYKVDSLLMRIPVEIGYVLGLGGGVGELDYLSNTSPGGSSSRESANLTQRALCSTP